MPMREVSSWPDLGERPPHDTGWSCATWLLGRHVALAALLDRTGLVSGTLEPDVELDELADAFTVLDAHNKAWVAYTRDHSPPQRDSDYDAYEARGPQLTDFTDGMGERTRTWRTLAAAKAIGPMSRTEKGRLRLLAFFAPSRVPINGDDLGGFDGNGLQIIIDWLSAIAFLAGTARADELLEMQRRWEATAPDFPEELP